jgi:Tol biopolymer transport system component
MSDTVTTISGPAQAAFTALVNGSPAVFAVQGNSAQPVIIIDLAEAGLTEHGAVVTPLLAPDGIHLAYCVSDQEMHKQPVIKLANLSDGSLSVLAQYSGQERFTNFTWKPDGSQLAYETVEDTPADNDPDLCQLWSVAVGGTPTKFYGDDVLQLLGWSGDGSKLYFTRRVQGFFSYSILDTATLKVEDAFLPDEVNGAALNIVGLTFGPSKDNTLLAYTLNASSYLQGVTSSPVMIVKADNGEVVKQFTANGAATYLAFSQDQSMLAYTNIQFNSPDTNEDDASGIQVYNLADGSTKDLIAPKTGELNYRVLDWSADNSGVFITSSDKSVQFVDFQGNQSTIVEAPPAEVGGLSVGGDLRVSRFGIQGAVVNLDTPYLHQVKMVPEGFDGNWACNACSATMVAGYYGKLPARNDTFRGNKSEYGWYIPSEFTSPDGKFVFNRVQNDASGHPAKGAYAHCTDGGDGYAWRIVDYLQHLGLKAVFRGSVTMNMIKQYLNDAKPIVLSTQIHNFGHIVCLKGYMPDGRLITNDPYWGRPGAGEMVYTWADLGTAWWMITVDDAPPPVSGGTPTPPATPPAAPSSPPPPPPPPPAPPEIIDVGTGNDAAASKFRDAYNRGGGSASLGQPGGKVYNYNQRWIQEFRGGARGDALIMLDERFDQAGSQPVPTVQPAFVVAGSFLRAWRDSYGGSAGVLGSPLSDEYVNAQGNRQQNLEGGYILMHGTGDDLDGAYPWPTQFNAWKAEYFNNAGLAGKPSYIRDEAPNATGGLEYNWGNDAPEGGRIGIRSDNFSVRYTRAINFADGGVFQFNVNADDGFRLMIDGQNLAGANPDQFWISGPTGQQTFRVQVGPGVHTLTLEYLEIGGGASLSLNINRE